MFECVTVQNTEYKDSVQFALNCTDCNYRERETITLSVFCTATLVYKYSTNSSLQLNSTYNNYTEAAATCELHNSTANLLYKYCTNCTVCNWTVLTVITHKLLLHVQLHNSTAHLLYKYCTNCTVCNWTVLTLINRSCRYMFSCTTVQRIYCTNTVQTVQSATELYLQ